MAVAQLVKTFPAFKQSVSSIFRSSALVSHSPLRVKVTGVRVANVPNFPFNAPSWEMRCSRREVELHCLQFVETQMIPKCPEIVRETLNEPFPGRYWKSRFEILATSISGLHLFIFTCVNQVVSRVKTRSTDYLKRRIREPVKNVLILLQQGLKYRMDVCNVVTNGADIDP